MYKITPIDGGIVALIIGAVQMIKKRVPDRLVPVLPFLVGWVLVVPAIIIGEGGVPKLSVFLSKIFLEGLKVGALASAGFKVGHTTVFGEKPPSWGNATRQDAPGDVEKEGVR